MVEKEKTGVTCSHGVGQVEVTGAGGEAEEGKKLY